jgi:hypothetical protein
METASAIVAVCDTLESRVGVEASSVDSAPDINVGSTGTCDTLVSGADVGPATCNVVWLSDDNNVVGIVVVVIVVVTVVITVVGTDVVVVGVDVVGTQVTTKELVAVPPASTVPRRTITVSSTETWSSAFSLVATEHPPKSLQVPLPTTDGSPTDTGHARYTASMVSPAIPQPSIVALPLHVASHSYQTSF